LLLGQNQKESELPRAPAIWWLCGCLYLCVCPFVWVCLQVFAGARMTCDYLWALASNCRLAVDIGPHVSISWPSEHKKRRPLFSPRPRGGGLNGGLVLGQKLDILLRNKLAHTRTLTQIGLVFLLFAVLKSSCFCSLVNGKRLWKTR